MSPTAPTPLHAVPPPNHLMADASKNIAQAAEEDKAINELKEYLEMSVKKLAAHFNRKEQHFWSLLHFKVKDNPSRRRTNAFNAVIHQLALQENKGKR